MAGHQPPFRFLVHLQTACCKSWPAVFGECLLDQLWHCSTTSFNNEIEFDSELCCGIKCKSRKGGSKITSDVEFLSHTDKYNSTETSSKNLKIGNISDSKGIENEEPTDDHSSRLGCFVTYEMHNEHLVLSEVHPNETKLRNCFLLKHPVFCPTRLQKQNKVENVKVESPSRTFSNASEQTTDAQEPTLSTPHTNNKSLETKRPKDCCKEETTKSSQPSSVETVVNRGVAVGVSVLVESSDGQVLMTRRAAQMRTFPGVWVPPGGHVERGEGLAAAGLRELLEETGVEGGTAEPQVLCMWESVYPPMLGYGDPVRQHLVVYMHLHLPVPAAQVQLQLDGREVDTCAWLTEDLARVIARGANDTEAVIPDTLPGAVVGEGGRTLPCRVDTGPLRHRLITSDMYTSRVSTGTRFAMDTLLSKRDTGGSGSVQQSRL